MKAPITNLLTANICAYTWGPWHGFLFSNIFPFTHSIKGEIQMANEKILNTIPSGTDCLLFHINLTNTTHFFRDKEQLLSMLTERGIFLLNEKISNISKSFIQSICSHLDLPTTLATEDGVPEEWLIVKTDFNFGGRQEKKLRPYELDLLRINATNYQDDTQYPIIMRKDIDQCIWSDPHYIVEKYISNSQNLFYRVYKLLDRMVISEVIDHNPIKKMPEGIPRQNAYCTIHNQEMFPASFSHLNGLLQQLTRFCNYINFEFGAIDIVLSDKDEYYIIDINSTPYWGGTGQQSILNFLSGADFEFSHFNT